MTTLCECNKCGEIAHAIKDTQHRRCGGSPKATPRDKHKKLPTARRGSWQ